MIWSGARDLTPGLTVPKPAYVVSSGVPLVPLVSSCTRICPPSFPPMSFCVLLVPRMRDTSVTRQVAKSELAGAFIGERIRL
jgi:hypothetical protein